MKFIGAAALFLILALGLACGGGGMPGAGGSVTLSLASGSAQAYQGQSAVTVNGNITRTGTTGNVTFRVTGLPAGASDTVTSPASGNSGSISLNAGTAAAGTYALTVEASDGTVSDTAPLTFGVGPVVMVGSATQGSFSVAMSTAFQPASWDYQFFTLNPSAPTTLENLGAQHTRLQGIEHGVPQGSEGTASTSWNFSTLDAVAQPVLNVGDHSPEFQIAKAPAFMYSGNNSGSTFRDLTFAPFAGYAQNLVAYYNTGGFTANSTHYESPAYADNGYKITYWGIYNEPSINNSLSASEYTDMYNALVPAMQLVDPSIKFVGLEMCCSSEDWALTFAQNVTAQVDLVASHYYSSCNQKDTDAMLMNSVPGFVWSVQTIRTNLSTNPLLMNVPIWVTENNVNADYNAGNNMSACNQGQQFVTDVRGSSAFFAGWRPYVFSQFGKAGVQALYHWDFDADKQFGEVDYGTAALQLSYWVDYWLGKTFPASAGSQLLQFTSTDDTDMETLPVVNSDGSVVVMVANHEVQTPASDNNGPGVPYNVQIDVSALGTFTSGSLVTIDKATSAASGPTPAAVTPAGQIVVNLNGYSVGILTLTP